MVIIHSYIDFRGALSSLRALLLERVTNCLHSHFYPTPQSTVVKLSCCHTTQAINIDLVMLKL